jgi:sporulation-control protein spo0M
MGLFDRFGAGGGKVTFDLASMTMTCGEKLVGTLVFTGGKREQVVEGMQIWFVKVEEGKDEILYAPTKIALRDVVQPGEVKRFLFEAVVPKVARLRVNGELVAEVFGLRGSLEIPKEIDPQGKLDGLQIEGGVEATMTVTAS